MTKAPINHITPDDVERFEKAALFQGPNLMELYQLIAVRRSDYPGKGTPLGLMYIALGLAEAGEVQGKVKKAFRDGTLIESMGPISDSPFENICAVQFGILDTQRRQQIIKELGGLLWYISAMCDEINVPLSDVARANLHQLADRTERGTLQGDGDDR